MFAGELVSRSIKVAACQAFKLICLFEDASFGYPILAVSTDKIGQPTLASLNRQTQITSRTGVANPERRRITMEAENGIRTVMCM